MADSSFSVDSLDKALSIWEGEDLMSVDLVTDINDSDIDEEVLHSSSILNLRLISLLSCR